MSSLIYQKYLEKLSKYSTMQETLYNLALFVATDSWWTRNRRYRSAKIGLYNLYIPVPKHLHLKQNSLELAWYQEIQNQSLLLQFLQY